MANEIKNDTSGTFKIMDEVAVVLEKVDLHDEGQYEENMRLQESGRNPLHVAKFKSNGTLSEIVFKYMFGKYLIWEIKLK